MGWLVGVVGSFQSRWSARSRMRGENRRPVRSNSPKVRSVYPAVSVVCSSMLRLVSLSKIASRTLEASRTVVGMIRVPYWAWRSDVHV